MRFHYDLAQASPVIRDTLEYDSGIIAGQMVGLTAVNASHGKGGVIDATTTLVDIVGVSAEAAASTAVQATGTDYYIKVIINPLAVWLAQWGGTASTNTVAHTTGEVITTAAIDGTQEGGWTYVNGPTTDTAYGNLFKIGAQTSTTQLTNVTGAAYDDELKANTTSSTFYLIRCLYANDPTAGATALDGTFAKLESGDETAGAAILLEHYISHSRFPMEPLRTTNHSGKNVPGATFYSDLYPTDHALRVATTY